VATARQDSRRYDRGYVRQPVGQVVSQRDTLFRQPRQFFELFGRNRRLHVGHAIVEADGVDDIGRFFHVPPDILYIVAGDGFADGFVFYQSGNGGCDALRRNFGAGGPGNAIEYLFAKVVLGPVVMKIASGERKASAFAPVFRHPRQVLGFFVLQLLAQGGITRTGAVLTELLFGRLSG